MEVLVAGQLEKTQSKDSASLSSFMLSHCCLYAIQMSIIMITKEEMWTASMTRQSDTPSFHSAHLPESDAEVFMTSFRTYLVAHWIVVEPSDSWDGGKSLLYPNPHSPPPWHTMAESGMGGTPLYVTLTLPAFASPPAPAHQTNKHLLRFPSFSRYIHPSTPLQTKLKLYQSPIDTVSLFIRMMKAAKCLLGLQLL